MLRIKRTLAFLLLAAIAVIPAIGCMDLATAPITQSTQTGVHVTNNRTAANNGLLDGVGGVVDGLVNDVGNLVFKTVDIVGSVGGTATNGRWTVNVPPGAVSGNASVSVGVVSPGSGRVTLDITPVTKNHFDTPVTLTVDCQNVPASQLRNYILYWRDPQAGCWVPVDGSTVDLAHRTVSAPLHHFSTYTTGPAGGKVGW
jgi:hypothetical protein